MEQVKKASDDLLCSMEQELKLVADLIGFAQQKEALLTASNAEVLNTVMEEEEETVFALREKEEERKGKAEALAQALCIPGPDAHLKTLLAHVDDPACRQRLADIGDEMKAAMKKLSLRNKKVRELLDVRTGYTEFMLNLLYSAQNRGGLYNMQGNREDKAGQTSRLDYRA